MTFSRTFAASAQEAFAALSGDFNPLHLDPVAARRTLFGRPVVHGVHTVLWVLDRWLAGRPGTVRIERVRALFRKPVGVGEEVSASLKRDEPGQAQFAVTGSSVMIEYSAGAAADAPIAAGRYTAEPAAPHAAEALAGLSGAIEPQLDPALAAALFPHLAARLPHWQIAALAAATRIVGMECPGLHSVFSEFDLRFSAAPARGPLRYRVKSYDARFRLTMIEISGAGASGTLKAFLRPEAAQQPAFSALRELVRPDEFSGHRALVVGGSRGLGEVAAKLLAAGGAEVRLTYHRGEADAARVVAEITAGGGRAACFALDAAHPVLPDGYAPTDLYYMATPFIFGATAGQFQEPLFQAFCAHYVGGFQTIARELLGRGLLRIFYPSSTAVEELPPNMFEYAAAKMAGETVAAFMAKHNPSLRVRCQRLPRVATDQTASVMPVENQDPVPILLAELRALKEQ